MYYNYINRLCNYLKLNWIQIILIILSIYDLRIDLRILFDYFTLSSLLYTICENPLPVIVLISIPNLFKSLK